MSRYIPNTKAQIDEMLKSIGVLSVEELFDSISDDIKLKGSLDLPEKMTEMELVRYIKNIAAANKNTDDYPCFLGAGAYDHYIPSVIDHILSREEFYTAYTPYQAEISQGVLQAIFEYQTMICELTGMEASNASMYDGASALAEACAISYANARKRNKIILASSMHPETKSVVKTYLQYKDVDIVEVGSNDGQLDLEELERLCDDTTAAVCIQTPNFYGVIEDQQKISEIVKSKKAAYIVSTDPISLGILKPPGDFGADFVVGEGQSLGNPIAYGGPYLGFFAASKKYVRKMPGRIVGQTIDSNGDRGFVLTLQAREQHIRREKATSNICSNQALNALAATIYLSIVGKEGLKEIAERCLNNAHYAYEQLLKTGKFKPVYNGPFFKEFAVESDAHVKSINSYLLDNGYIGGYELGNNKWLIAVTEKRTKAEIDDFVKKAGEV